MVTKFISKTDDMTLVIKSETAITIDDQLDLFVDFLRATGYLVEREEINYEPMAARKGLEYE